MESKLETVMQTLVAVFHEYSSKEGDKFKLNKNELKSLIKNELNPEENVRLEQLDLDGDGEVDFKEFAIKIAEVTMRCNAPPKSKNQAAKKASNLNTAMQTLVEVFNEYASKEGDKNSLNKSELKTLLQKELQLENASNPQKVEEMLNDLDDNGDGVVDFNEFVIMFAAMTILCNEFFEEILQSDQV